MKRPKIEWWIAFLEVLEIFLIEANAWMLFIWRIIVLLAALKILEVI